MTDDVLRGRGIEPFLEDLASSSPAPGGGAAAGLAGAAGASLVSMVGHLTAGKQGYEDVSERMRELISEADAARQRLLDIAERDATAFEGVIAALRMPKDTEEQKTVRASAIQTGYEDAAEVPLELIREAVGLLDASVEVTEKGNVHAASDGVCAARLLETAARCAAYNVEINVSALKDAARAGALRDEVAALLRRGADRLNAAEAAFAERLA